MINLFDPCDVCRILQPEPSQTGTVFHTLDLTHIAESAQAKTCFLCSLIYTAIVDHGYVEPINNSIYFRTGINEPFFLMWIEQSGSSPHLEIFRQTGSQSTIEGLGWANAIPKEPNNPVTTNKILEWIRTCEENHPECRVNGLDPPARLLDLENPGPESICLVQGIEPSKYVALSHCWGDTRWCTTTNDNLTRHLSAIKWDELAKTFQDAVTVSRQLGVRYLWIDSLCIIQNDLDDWKKESVKMGDIYRGAYLTIAATLASADDEGFLHPSREREVYSATCLRVPFRGEVITDVWAREIHDFRLHSFHNIREPLSNRAWTMQERVLASRLLSYSSAVTFECTSSAMCECGYGLYPDPYYPPLHMLSGIDNKLAFLSLLNGDPQPIEKMYSLWSDMVTVYSGRRLAYETDRQIAISAIARALAKQYGDEYVAGIWKGDIIHGLAWHNDVRSPRIKNPSNFTTQEQSQPPSWSWLSAEKLVLMHNISPGSCELLSMDVQDGGTDDSGPPRGCIKLRAQTGSMVIHVPNGSQLDSDTSGISKFELFGPQNKPVDKFEVHEFLLDRSIEKSTGIPGPGIELDGTNFSLDVLCLHLGKTTVSTDGPQSDVFLALVARGHTPTVYSRIGTVRATIAEDGLREWLGKSKYDEVTIY